MPLSTPEPWLNVQHWLINGCALTLIRCAKKGCSMKHAMRSAGALLLGLIWATVIGIPVAAADTISYDIETGSAGLSGYTGPFVNLSINRTDSTHATLTYTALTSSGGTYLYTM